MLKIHKRARRDFSAPLMRNLLGTTAYDASDAGGELLFCATRMAHKILASIADSVLHQIMCEVSIIQVGPCAQQGVRPSRFRGGLQLLIGSIVARAPGPTPSQVFPVRFHWRLRERWPRRGDLTTSNDIIGNYIAQLDELKTFDL